MKVKDLLTNRKYYANNLLSLLLAIKEVASDDIIPSDWLREIIHLLEKDLGANVHLANVQPTDIKRILKVAFESTEKTPSIMDDQLDIPTERTPRNKGL